MNQSQLKYCRERINDIHHDRVHNIRMQRYGDFKRMSAKERKKALKEGRWEFRANAEKELGCPPVRLEEVIKFHDEYEEPGKSDEQIGKEVEAENRRRRELLDELMLGDQNEALKMLRQYENGER